MKFVNTRSGEELNLSSYEAILHGKVSDGLIAPKALPPAFTQEEILEMKYWSFAKMAARVISRFFDDIDSDKILHFAREAYDKDHFDKTKEVLPVYDFKNDIFLIEQWHGRTGAFKDIPLSIFPLFIQEALEKEGKDRRILMLTATSGDTGSAGEAGFSAIPRVMVAVMFPEVGKVSYVQKRQMIDLQTEDNPRISAYSVLDNFDFCQNKLVKPLLEDYKFKEELKAKYNVQLSSLNSINIGRIAPQIVSSFQIYRKIVDKIGSDASFDICVPTGNFGHVLSAYFAKQMGVPIRKFIIATNKNDVLHRFIQTGRYAPHGFHKTISPSMDIAISSNLERLLFYIAGHEKVAKWMNELQENGEFTVCKEVLDHIQESFDSGSANEEETKEQISKIWKNHKRILDPHSAVAMCVAEKRKEEGIPMVFCETAHWSKFVKTTSDILFDEEEKLDGSWEIERMKEIDEILKKEGGTPRVPRFMKNISVSNRSTKKSNFLPDVKDLKEILIKQIEESSN